MTLPVSCQVSIVGWQISQISRSKQLRQKCRIWLAMARMLPKCVGVTIRIMRGQEDASDVLYVVGWLKGEEADELLRIADASGPGLVLDLSELREADAYGIVALRSLADRGVKLEQVPQLIALMLENSSA